MKEKFSNLSLFKKFLYNRTDIKIPDTPEMDFILKTFEHRELEDPMLGMINVTDNALYLNKSLDPYPDLKKAIIYHESGHYILEHNNPEIQHMVKAMVTERIEEIYKRMLTHHKIPHSSSYPEVISDEYKEELVSHYLFEIFSIAADFDVHTRLFSGSLEDVFIHFLYKIDKVFQYSLYHPDLFDIPSNLSLIGYVSAVIDNAEKFLSPPPKDKNNEDENQNQQNQNQQNNQQQQNQDQQNNPNNGNQGSPSDGGNQQPSSGSNQQQSSGGQSQQGDSGSQDNSQSSSGGSQGQESSSSSGSSQQGGSSSESSGGESSGGGSQDQGQGSGSEQQSSSSQDKGGSKGNQNSVNGGGGSAVNKTPLKDLMDQQPTPQKMEEATQSQQERWERKAKEALQAVQKMAQAKEGKGNSEANVVSNEQGEVVTLKEVSAEDLQGLAQQGRSAVAFLQEKYKLKMASITPFYMLKNFILSKLQSKGMDYAKVKDPMYITNRGKRGRGSDVMPTVIRKVLQPTKSVENNIVFLLDVSGSMDSSTLLKVVQTLMGLKSYLGRRGNYRIISWDTNLTGDFDITKGNIDHLETGGGTHIARGIDYALEKYIKTGNDRLFVLSDLEDDLAEWDRVMKESRILNKTNSFVIGVPNGDGHVDTSDIGDITVATTFILNLK